MTIDFSKINDEWVGYKVRTDDTKLPEHRDYNFLENLTFEEFISPHIHEAKHPRQVYQNLEFALAKSKARQDLRTNKKRLIIMDLLAIAALEREAIRNAQNLIEKNYF